MEQVRKEQVLAEQAHREQVQQEQGRVLTWYLTAFLILTTTVLIVLILK